MKEPSPLLVWKLIGVVIAVGVTIMLFVDPMRPVIDKRDDYLAARLASINFAEDTKGMIFFGNSLMNQALPFREHALRDLLSLEFEKLSFPGRIDAIEVTAGGVNAWRLRAFADLLVQSGASVIVIQSEMFVPRHRKTKQEFNRLNRIGIWSGIVNLQLFGRSQPAPAKRKTAEIAGVEKKPRKTRKQVQTEETLEIARGLWANQNASETLPEFVAARDFVKKVSSRGITIVVVELPVSETAVRFATEQYFRDRSKLIEGLSQYGVIHMKFPRVLPDGHFRDYSHLNTRGRVQFLNWFLPELARVLSEG